MSSPTSPKQRSPQRPQGQHDTTTAHPRSHPLSQTVPQSSAEPVTASSSAGPPPGATEGTGETKNKKKKRGGRKRRGNRRQSFAAPSEASDVTETNASRPPLESLSEHPAPSGGGSTFYRLGATGRMSRESLDSEILLDHRDQTYTRPRRQSTHQSLHGSRPSIPNPDSRSNLSAAGQTARTRRSYDSDSDGDDENNVTDRTPLIPQPHSPKASRSPMGYGGTRESRGRRESNNKAGSSSSSLKSSKKARRSSRPLSAVNAEYDINNPPSLPGSPRIAAHEDLREIDVAFDHPSNRTEAIIDIDEDQGRRDRTQSPPDFSWKRQTPEEDVCLPFDNDPQLGYDHEEHHPDADGPRQHRRRKRQWPDLEVLQEWAREEKEQWTAEEVAAKKVSEPVLVEGRLRPRRSHWRRDEEELPFRWTYFNEEFDSSLRSHTLSGLQQLGHTFKELFIPNRPEIESSSSEDSSEEDYQVTSQPPSRLMTRNTSLLEPRTSDKRSSSGEHTGRSTPVGQPTNIPKVKRYGPRPVFWLDVFQPTYDEMRVISRAFGIHKLTAEDIMEQEEREKVELFRNYYFVNYRTFEQDTQSESYLDPVNMYFVVFKGGVISFHFSQMPHPPNVRRRMRQLAEHQYTDSDWIAYALIDNITDAYAPLIEQIEEEVDQIDEEILSMHSRQQAEKNAEASAKTGKGGHKSKTIEKHQEEIEAPVSNTGDAGRDMLLRVGECRKKVMELYRLLSNKADVIKGLAKRVNDQWTVGVPRTDVGLYLGDIQDHIITMTGNLTHYENMLARAHSNYLAQINILMNERAEQTGDALNKLTVLGTIVLPMNIVTGMWGMNCIVPGQDVDNLYWFFGITAFLIAFGFSCFFIARRAYNIV